MVKLLKPPNPVLSSRCCKRLGNKMQAPRQQGYPNPFQPKHTQPVHPFIAASQSTTITYHDYKAAKDEINPPQWVLPTVLVLVDGVNVIHLHVLPRLLIIKIHPSAGIGIWVDGCVSLRSTILCFGMITEFGKRGPRSLKTLVAFTVYYLLS